MGKGHTWNIFVQKRAQFPPLIPFGEVQHQQILRPVFEILPHVLIVCSIHLQSVFFIVLGKSFSLAVNPFMLGAAEMSDVGADAVVPFLLVADGEDELGSGRQVVQFFVDAVPRGVLHRIHMTEHFHDFIPIAPQNRNQGSGAGVFHFVSQYPKRVTERGGSGLLKAHTHNQSLVQLGGRDVGG